MTEKIIKHSIIFFFILFVIKSLFASGFFESKYYQGNGFKILKLENWEITREEELDIDTKIVEFSTLDVDPLKEIPLATITILAHKLTQGMWIQDEFGTILGSIHNAGYKILDRGDIKIDKQIGKWVLYDDKDRDELNFEFYLTTDNQMLFKISYQASPKVFGKYRPDFEALKESFKLKFGI